MNVASSKTLTFSTTSRFTDRSGEKKVLSQTVFLGTRMNLFQSEVGRFIILLETALCYFRMQNVSANNVNILALLLPSK